MLKNKGVPARDERACCRGRCGRRDGTNGRAARARRQTARCGTAAAHRRAVWCGPAAAHRRAGGGGWSARRAEHTGRARLTDARQASCPSIRPARARGWHGAASQSARTAGTCKTARANPGTLCSSATKKDEALHLWRSCCKKHGGLHALFMQTHAILTDASAFSQDSIAAALLESCKPRQFLRKKGLSCKPIDLLRSSRGKSWALHFPAPARTSRKPPHANPSFNCETNAGSCVLYIFQPSPAVEQLTILTDRLVYCIVFAKKEGPCIWQPLSALPCRTKGPAGACRFEIIARDYNLWMGFYWGDPIFKDCRWKNPAILFL